MAYAEIGTLIPKSGGEYIYFLEAFGPTNRFFGPIPAFLFAWVTIFLLHPSELAITSLSFAKYLLTPILKGAGLCLDPYLDTITTRLVAAAAIGMLILRVGFL